MYRTKTLDTNDFIPYPNSVSKQKITLGLIFFLSIIAGVFIYQPVWNKLSQFRPWLLGLDLAGGTQLTYEVDLSKVQQSDKESVLNGLHDVIERRVNLFGVSEPKVYTVKSNTETRLIAELAGITNVTSAIDEIGTTPFLEFMEVGENKAKQNSKGPLNSSTTAEESENENHNSTSTSTLTFNPTELTGRYVSGAQVTFDHLGQSAVALNFNKDGAKIFENLTEKNIGLPIAIFLDGELITMPTVNEKIVGGRAQISGNFTPDEAKILVQRFNAGALPAPITLINQHTVSAKLGTDSLKKALTAGIIGAILIMAFMVIYYKKFGIFASIALLLYIALTLGIFKLIPITMSLAGIAGFLLSIGMAVDANILVFERTKEELKRGLEKSKAIEEGFKRAWTSIRDSNISTIITAIALYYFTSSFVRGFALTLMIGVLISMFSAITITRTMLRVLIKNSKF